ncbi:CsgE family curli-type amyloid fiber assembly protein [Persicitalea sp.]|uniref:CsgE family curli-type amyloid fiber assembly protein n=1 Tax=Persicitalea sp. TaxID=3100273 RepID=UPI00359360B2
MCLLGILLFGECRGQDVESGGSVEGYFDESQAVAQEQNLFLESATGIFLLDETRTKNGRDFYEYVYQRWLTIQSDTTLISPTAFADIGEELTVSIDEQPVPGGIGTSTIVSVSVNDVMIYQQFLQPRLGVVEEMAGDAANMLTQYIQYFQEYQKQLGSEDQKGNGIY